MGTRPKDALPQGLRPPLTLPTEVPRPTQAAKNPLLSYPSSWKTYLTWVLLPAPYYPKST